jgi:hypothetical protein
VFFETLAGPFGKPPFSPEDVVAEFSVLLKSYRISKSLLCYLVRALLENKLCAADFPVKQKKWPLSQLNMGVVPSSAEPL